MKATVVVLVPHLIDSILKWEKCNLCYLLETELGTVLPLAGDRIEIKGRYFFIGRRCLSGTELPELYCVLECPGSAELYMELLIESLNVMKPGFVSARYTDNGGVLVTDKNPAFDVALQEFVSREFLNLHGFKAPGW